MWNLMLELSIITRIFSGSCGPLILAHFVIRYLACAVLLGYVGNLHS